MRAHPFPNSRFRALPALAGLLALGLTPGPAHAAGRADEDVSPKQVLEGLRTFYQKTARPDGSFTPGIDPGYLGMSDSAYSDLAPVTYACTIHRTFGWRLPYEKKTVEFLLSRQKKSG